jgi:hypothetical protein
MVTLTEEQLEKLLIEAWFNGHNESRYYCPNKYRTATAFARETIKEIKDDTE